MVECIFWAIENVENVIYYSWENPRATAAATAAIPVRVNSQYIADYGQAAILHQGWTQSWQKEVRQ
jgi:hypothetical protein